MVQSKHKAPLGPAEQQRTALKVVYADNAESRHALAMTSWGKRVLAQPDETYANGRSSWECAHEAIQEAEDALLDHYALQVIA